MELAIHLNEVQTTKAVRLAKLCGVTMVYTLKKAHQESILVLECQVMDYEGQAHQTFVEAFRVAMGSCLPESQGALLCPLQLLTGDMPLATLLGMSATAQLQVVGDEEPAPTAPNP